MNVQLSNTSFFDTITQYDNKYDKLWKDNPYVNKGLCCPLFALISAERFLKNGQINRETHEENIDRAIDTYILLNNNKELTFEELINYTDLDSKDIMCTTTELINSGEFSLEELFDETFNDDNNTNYSYCNAVIFLKNAKFFVVMYDVMGYYIRDCHEQFQYNFSTLEELITHLNNIYQFNTTINLDGVVYSDYSSIEYIKINRKINNVLRNIKKYQFEDCNNDKLENSSLIGYIDTDESFDYNISDSSE